MWKLFVCLGLGLGLGLGLDIARLPRAIFYEPCVSVNKTLTATR